MVGRKNKYNVQEDLSDITRDMIDNVNAGVCGFCDSHLSVSNADKKIIEPPKW